jgi:hypothetical protein
VIEGNAEGPLAILTLLILVALALRAAAPGRGEPGGEPSVRGNGLALLWQIFGAGACGSEGDVLFGMAAF